VFRTFTNELYLIERAINDGSEICVEQIDALLTRIRTSLPELETAEIRLIDKQIRQIEFVGRDRYEEIGEELRSLSLGRKALRGYSHLRGFDYGQRLYRRA
jgi:hypothetical protein